MFDKSILKVFFKYVGLNILSMLGLSCYILADTFFISKALGATGLAALNFSLPVYSLINGTGLMIGIGGATRYSILKAQNKDKKSNLVYTHCIGFGVLIGLIFLIVGITASNYLALFLGADINTLDLTKIYLMTILCFAPFFILNNIVNAFVRNDNNPKLSMVAMLSGSISNIVLDYIFMFPLGMGMFGAAFATCLAPIICLGVLSVHFIKKNNRFSLLASRVEFKSILDIICLGSSSFITEISSAISLITFNLVILTFEGNVGVASYSIVANIAFVGISIFTGIAQGIQPIISEGYGMNNKMLLKGTLKLSLLTSIIVSFIMYLGAISNSDSIVAIFNSEGNLRIAQLAKSGLMIYFTGFFFAGINIILSSYFSAIEEARNAFIISILRGVIIIVPMVFFMSKLMAMTGIWLSFSLTELIVTALALIILRLTHQVASNKG